MWPGFTSRPADPRVYIFTPCPMLLSSTVDVPVFRGLQNDATGPMSMHDGPGGGGVEIRIFPSFNSFFVSHIFIYSICIYVMKYMVY